MARKKSKGSKKARATKPGEESIGPDRASGPGEGQEDEPAALDADALDADLTDGDPIDGPIDEDPVEVDVVDMDAVDVEDVDESADELLASVLALAGGDNAGDADPADPGAAPGRPSDPAGEDDVRSEGADARAAADPEAPGDVGADRPVMGVEAFLALTEIRAEGVASRPGEMVLDLGDESSPGERDRLLAATLAHAETQEAIYRIPVAETRSRRLKGGIAATIVLVASFVAVAPPPPLVPDPTPALDAAERDRGVRIALLLQAEQIEAFRVDNGRLPRSLDEVATTLPDIRFVRSSNRLYQLVARTAEGEAVVYDSAAPAAAFTAIRRELTGFEEPS